MNRILSLLFLWLLVAGPAEAGLFHRKKKTEQPRAVYGMSKAQQRKHVEKSRKQAQKQRAQAIKNPPKVRVVN
ncbi:MAG: hypothetical protein HY820_11780 [Acidobacteria bacterium]|nr:hypothetical protein [Acidobacteriota bacterium]